MDNIEQFSQRAAEWLEASLPRKERSAFVWGDGSDSMAVFPNRPHEEEREHLDLLRDWQRTKFDAGYGAITWPAEHGGAGFSEEYKRTFQELEAGFETPPSNDVAIISLDIVGPTIMTWGTTAQVDRFLRPLRRGDELWCQLFSEPGAGSDLASLSTKAEKQGDTWVLNGQKVWTSGAQFADFGYVLCRTSDKSKHGGVTAFLLPMHYRGVEVRPLRQMTGGSAFNEVFLTDVRLTDEMRLGPVDGGWKVAMTSLSYERLSVLSAGRHDDVDRLIRTAQHLGRTADPFVRQTLVTAWCNDRVAKWTGKRYDTEQSAGIDLGSKGSICKLAFAENIKRVSSAASLVLGTLLTADGGKWGIYAWAEYVLGAPGQRLAGGSDEIQRNAIAERVLGLPKEPRPR